MEVVGRRRLEEGSKGSRRNDACGSITRVGFRYATMTAILFARVARSESSLKGSQQPWLQKSLLRQVGQGEGEKRIDWSEESVCWDGATMNQHCHESPNAAI